MSLWQDIRFGVRMLVRSPLFTIAAIVCLGLGIGVNAAIFPFFYEFLIDPLPFEKSNELVVIENLIVERGMYMSISYPDYLYWRDNNHVFSHLAASDFERYTFTGRGDPERLVGARITSNYFDMLGGQPVSGRGIRPEDEEPGAPAVVLLGYGFWQRRFGGDAGIIGETLTLEGKQHTVIGIMPRDFAFPNQATIWTAFQPGNDAQRGYNFLTVTGRLKQGVSRDDAQREMTGLAAVLAEEFPDTNRGLSALVIPLKDDLLGSEYQGPVSIFYGVVCFILLLACANVANLLLARAAAREREIAVRVTLGAGRFRVMRQMLTESVMLAMFGGAIGIVLGGIGRDLIVRYIPEEIPYYLEFNMNIWVILSLVAITAFCGILFGMAPSLEAFRSNLNQALTEGSGRTAGSRRLNWFRSSLVVFEIGLALVVLTGAGLMMKGFLRLYTVDPGFERQERLTLRLDLPADRYTVPQQASQFFLQLLERFEQLPGVESAAMTSQVPMYGNWASGFQVEGQEPDPEGRMQITNRRTVSPGYFSCMDIPLLRGRGFDERDDQGTPPVAVINELMADHFWPGGDPLGKTIAFGSNPSAEDWMEIVGVVGNVRQGGLTRDIRWCVYGPMKQTGLRSMYYVLKTAGDPLGMADPVRRVIWSMDADLPVFLVRTLKQVIRESNWEEPLYAMLFGIFAVIALVLASVGVYGVVAYSVSQRTREFGIRMALGADSGAVRRLVVGRGALLGVVGIVLGLAGSCASMKVLESLLLGVRHDDPAVYAFAALVMAVMTLAASYLPSRRATGIDPVETLRAE